MSDYSTNETPFNKTPSTKGNNSSLVNPMT